MPFLIAILCAAAALSVACFVLAKPLLFRIVPPDLSEVHGVGRKYDLALLLLFAPTVALGVKLVGTPVIGALTIIPDVVARNVSLSTRGYVTLSAIPGAGSGRRRVQPSDGAIHFCSC